jgi:L-ascorbate metabolism protein UlaG (beta-lactamase superfamily)
MLFENVGYIIDDGNKRLYTTSDTIIFNADYKCDILCMPFNGNGLTMGIVEGTMFAKDINPELLIPVHTEMALSYMNPNLDTLKAELEKAGINYKILDIKESIEI